jgi:glycosyltransferase involved in cell wall biosynthesis
VRLLHVVPTYLPAVRYGGPIWVVHGLCRALRARGHAVTVYTTSVDGPADSAVEHGAPVDLDGVEVRYFRSRWGRRIYWSPPMGAALRTAVPSFDLVHLHSIFLWPTLAAARTARDRQVPYLVAPHGMLVKHLVRQRGFLRKSAWIRLFERRNLEGAAAVHATTPLESQEVLRFGFALRRVVVIPNGIDVSDEAPERRESGVSLLSLGRVSWKKGIDRVIDALPFVPGARFVVAGNDEEGLVPRLAARAADRGVADRVQFVGAVYGGDKDRLLDSASLFVLPSYGENFGHAVLEAMARGLPVAVTREVGLSEDVASAGAGIVVPPDPEPLGRSLARLLASPQERRAMGERGHALARRYSWDAVASEYEACARDLLDRSGP